METLTHPDFQNRAYGIVDCGALLWHLQNNRVNRYARHRLLSPGVAADSRQPIGSHIWIAGVGWPGAGLSQRFSGILAAGNGILHGDDPLAAAAGYRFVLVDSEHVRPVGRCAGTELRYRPHIARFGGEEIIVIVRDRDLSDAQETGHGIGVV
jgi:hypothetical protein